MHSTKRTGALVSLSLIALTLAGCSSTTAGNAASDSGSSSAASSSSSSSAAPAAKAASWYAKHHPTFATKTFTGKGDDVLSLPKGATKGVLTAQHTGSANFIISVLDDKNQQTTDSGVNAIGNFKGTVAYGLAGMGSEAKTLKVQADGKWSITVSDFDQARALPSSGKGDGVYKYDGPSKTAEITHDGQANFIVNEYSDAAMSNLQINEIGKYSGKSLVDPGPAIVTIEADGAWTIK